MDVETSQFYIKNPVNYFVNYMNQLAIDLDLQNTRYVKRIYRQIHMAFKIEGILAALKTNRRYAKQH